MTCSPVSSDSILSRTEIIWNGGLCESDGLRYSNFGVAGRSGFYLGTFDDFCYFSANNLVTPFHATCDLIAEGYIQSYNLNPDSTNEYSVFTFPSIGDDLFSSVSHLEITPDSTSDTAIFDLPTNQTTAAMSGIKNILFYGVAGNFNFSYQYNSTTFNNYGIESGGVFVADSSSISKGTETVPLPVIQLGSRSPDNILSTLTTADPLYSSFPVVELDATHCVCGRLVRSGATYSVYIDLYTANFTTKKLDLTSSTLLWADEPAPLVYPFGSNRICFVPTRNTLYIGQPHYTGTKTNEGRLYALNWNGTSLSVGTHLTYATRVAFLGSCIGWDAVNNYIIIGFTGDDIHAIKPDNTKISMYTGPSNSKLGWSFAVGDGYMLARDNSITATRLFSIGATALSYLQVNYFFDASSTVNYAGVIYPNGRSGVRVPFLQVKNGSYYGWSYKTQASNGMTSGSSYASPADTLSVLCWSRLPSSPYKCIGWDNSYVVSNNLQANWNYVFSNLLSDTLTGVSPLSSVAMCFSNGTDEFYVYAFCSTDQLSRKYFTIERVLSPSSHTQIGDHYLSHSIDLSSCDDIISATLSYSNYLLDSTVSLKFFIRINNGSYYIINSDGSTSLQASVSVAKTNAVLAEHLSTRLPLLNVTSIDTLELFFVFHKDLSEVSPLSTQSISSLNLELHVLPPSEPEIVLHYSSGTLTEVAFNANGTLQVTPASAPQAPGFSLVTVKPTFREVF